MATEKQLKYWKSMKGHPQRNTGKTHFKKGNPAPKTAFKKGQKAWNTGLTKETDERVRKYGIKVGQSNKGKGRGRKFAICPTCKKMKGNYTKMDCFSCYWQKRKKRGLSIKERKSLRERWLGENNPNWSGGKNEPYSPDWTITLRRSIRERDNYVCKLCGKIQGDEVHCVHHIDYDKKNCDPKNLITLCRSCNIKVNHNKDYWTNYFYVRGNFGTT